jgi:DNA-binding response OmpR family regulator
MPSIYSPSEEVQTDHKTVLIIEDDASIGACLVQAIVEETPYLAFFVTDSLDALHVLEDIKPDLLVIDYRLPHINGIELYDRIHAQKVLADIPGIVISAELPQRETQQRHLIGMQKPFDLDELLNTIHELLA